MITWKLDVITIYNTKYFLKIFHKLLPLPIYLYIYLFYINRYHIFITYESNKHTKTQIFETYPLRQMALLDM